MVFVRRRFGWPRRGDRDVGRGARFWRNVSFGLVLGLFLAASCRAEETYTDQLGAAQPELLTAPLDYSVALKPWKGDYDGMLQRRMIRILVPYSRTYFFLDGATMRGLLAATGRQLEREINRREGLRTKLLHVVFIPVARNQRIPWLIAGRGDIAAGDLAVTEGRKEIVDFTIPFFRNVRDVVVTGPTAAPTEVMEDLAGQRIFIQPSSVALESLGQLNETLRSKGLAPVATEAIDELLEPDEILELVQAGAIPATIVNRRLADFWAQVFPKLTVHSDIVVAEERDIAWAIRKNSPKLKAELNEFVRAHRHRTEFGNIVVRRYLQNLEWVQSPKSSIDRDRYEQAMPLFRRFGIQYDLDPLFLAALGYQESRLNQGARSPVGAIGVMQVMPLTGELMNVGDITKLEPNIHAGVRYFSRLVRGIGGDELDWLNKSLLALASYNGGQTRIRRLRRETEEQGLDPNIWFNNVELIVARRIGRETVQFVRNVYRYYLVFRLVEKERRRRRGNESD